MSDWMQGMTDFQRAEVARLESRAYSCERRFESLHLDEIEWKKERKTLRAQLASKTDELAAAIKERDEAHAQLRAEAALIAECRGGRWTAKSVAKERGWKCFTKGGGA